MNKLVPVTRKDGQLTYGWIINIGPISLLHALVLLAAKPPMTEKKNDRIVGQIG
jgi:hypothetical protein